MLAIAECDVLADGNYAMTKKVRDAGVAVEAHIYEGATHSFLEAMAFSLLANRALDDAAAWLRATLDEREIML